MFTVFNNTKPSGDPTKGLLAVHPLKKKPDANIQHPNKYDLSQIIAGVALCLIFNSK